MSTTLDIPNEAANDPVLLRASGAWHIVNRKNLSGMLYVSIGKRWARTKIRGSLKLDAYRWLALPSSGPQCPSVRRRTNPQFLRIGKMRSGSRGWRNVSGSRYEKVLDELAGEKHDANPQTE